MDCRVVVEAAVPVYDVGTPDEAVRIAISKTGEMLNPDLSYVDIEMGSRASPSGEELPPAFVAADEALVALELGMDVFNVEDEQHARRIARTEIGGRLPDVPLKVLSVSALNDGDGTPTDGSGDSTENGDTGDGTQGVDREPGRRSETDDVNGADLLSGIEDLPDDERGR